MTALKAFKDVDFSWVRPLESIWSDDGTAGGGPHRGIVDDLIDDFIRATKDPKKKPPGRVIIGEAGSGKTHLVGDLRKRAWQAGGWFVLLDVIGITDFWKSAALSYLTSLLQLMPDGRRQSEAVLAGVARRLKVERQVEAAFQIPDVDAKRIVDLLVPGLATIDFSNAQSHQDVFRALALLRSNDFAAVGIAHSWLQGYEADEDARKALGLLKPPPSPIDLVRGMSWVMSLAAPTLIGVDQIDGVIASGAVTVAGDDLADRNNFGDVLAAGLLQLFDATTRSQTVVACLRESWKTMAGGALKSALHRFEAQPIVLAPMSDAEAIGDVIADRLSSAYGAVGYRPEYSTWPFTPAAVGSARGMMPRNILMACDAFRRECLLNGSIEPCDNLAPEMRPPPPPPPGVGGFDDDFAEASRKAAIADLIDAKNDSAIGLLLREIFDLYARQIVPRENVDVVSKGDPAQRMPPLHGRLTFTFHAENDRELHFCFRAIEHDNAIAFQARLKAALTASGISSTIRDRHLLLVRRGSIPGGAKTRDLHAAFVKAEGRIIDPSDDDLRSFVALVALRDKAIADGNLANFEAWLQTADPLCRTAFFKVAGLCPPPGLPPLPDVPPPSSESLSVQPEKPRPQEVTPEPVASAKPAPIISITSDAIPIGHRLSTDAEPVLLPTNILPRHTAIIAGAGSGKTVLLRRIVEEAALAGIPAIVIDPNNDLSRLGDAWPDRPANFTQDDDAKAKAYQESVEVVVWTPGIHAGNPLFLSVLPDFAEIGDDPDERSQAVTMAAETLGPLATAKTDLAKGVLADALRHFAGKGGGTLKDMTTLLADLPEGVSEIDKADQIANKMANGLRAAVATNPLLKTAGAVLDPRLLFDSARAGKTRISVINLSGLASQDAKEDFVNRLQMTLFGWIKKHPSPKGMLYVIDEAQTFLPSGAAALSKTSGVQLVAQARKYGLGMIVVTQAPKGIDNKVVSNCTTQFLGKQNSPTDQQTVRDMVAGTGGRADDIGKLKVGEFYFKSEGTGKPVKIATPVCLSHHPANPPTPEEVVARAKASTH